MRHILWVTAMTYFDGSSVIFFIRRSFWFPVLRIPKNRRGFGSLESVFFWFNSFSHDIWVINYDSYSKGPIVWGHTVRTSSSSGITKKFKSFNCGLKYLAASIRFWVDLMILWYSREFEYFSSRINSSKTNVKNQSKRPCCLRLCCRKLAVVCFQSWRSF